MNILWSHLKYDSLGQWFGTEGKEAKHAVKTDNKTSNPWACTVGRKNSRKLSPGLHIHAAEACTLHLIPTHVQNK